MYDEHLLEVRKPAQYIGLEWNVSRKEFDAAEVKFALCFPDLYEIGMSNLGMRILYGVTNNIPWACCERFFAPAQDLEAVLRNNRLEILSLESRKRLKDFDLVGFSLGYELSYSNVLNILELGNIPLSAAQRDKSFPLVIAGGPCVLNPEPMHEFFDLFVIGEAEEALRELLEVYRQHKEAYQSGRLSKEELLIALAAVEGVYAPSLYQVSYDQQGGVIEFRPAHSRLPLKIKKRYLAELDTAFVPLDWLVPYIQIVHDRITLEVMRGCPNRCRFCQARILYYPFRVKSVDKVTACACEIYKRTGYEEISLAGLSVSDYPHLEELLQQLFNKFDEKKIGLSLPSIKPKLMVGRMAELIAAIRKTGLTFAPEAGSGRLREVIGKDFDEGGYFEVLEKAYAAGYQHVKLYFMTGLPTEEEADLDAIIGLINRTSEARKKISGHPAWVNVSINTLIPKPHTSFQWCGMGGLEEMREKQRYLKSRIKNKRVKFNFHNPEMSFMEAVFSRGDRRLGKVIRAAFAKGARFDGWENHFNFSLWQEAFREAQVDPQFYLRGKSSAELLPWDFLDSAVQREILLKDYNKIIA